jgi:hypothetical protein
VIGWIVKLIPAPYRVGAALAAVGILAVGSGVAGWTARDYFADRKELKAAKAQVERLTELAETWELAARGWEAAVTAQNALAAKFAMERNESQARADRLSQDIALAKAKLTKLEKASEENGGLCERTDECHWLLFNAAVNGTEAPSQCTAAGSVQD